MKFEQSMRDPHAVFGSPEALENWEFFSTLEKAAILVQWQDQVVQLLIADDEGMPRTDIASRSNAGKNAECLRRVTDAIGRLSWRYPVRARGSVHREA